MTAAVLDGVNPHLRLTNLEGMARQLNPLPLNRGRTD